MESPTGILKLYRSFCATFAGMFYLLSLVGALSIIEQPRSKGVQEGTTFTLNCVVESASQTYVVWYKEESPGSNIPLSSYKTIRREAPEAERLSIIGAGNTYNLRIIRARTADEGSYQCVAYSRGSSVKSTIARVTVLPAGESVMCQTYPQHVHIGDTLRYTCRPPPSMPSSTTMAWWKGVERVPLSSVIRLQDGGLQLRYAVGEMDNYVPFTCTVGTDFTQAYGLNCSSIPLQIPLDASLDPVFNKVSVGRNAAFRCSAVASPPVNKIKWLVGFGKSAKISGTGGRYEVKSNPKNLAESTLIIKNVVTSDNGTSVRCVLQNDLRQKDIAQAFVIVNNNPLTPDTIPPATTRRPQITRRPVIRTTRRPVRRTQRPRTRMHAQRPIATTARPKATNQPIAPQRTTKPLTTKFKQFFQPYHPGRDVEISVHGGMRTKGINPSIETNDNGEDNFSSPQSSSNLISIVATICVLLILLLVIGGVVYFVVFRRKLLKKNNFNGEVKYRKSYDPKGELTTEERAAARMSLRLQTIEVVVNQPPPEWQSKLKDVKPVENDFTKFNGKPDGIPESPPPAYSRNPTDNNKSLSNEEQNGVDRRNSQEEEIENDAIYALPAKKPSTSKREHDENRENHQKASRQVSDTRKRLLSQDYNDQNNEVDDDIEWDQSSWDNSSFEDEEETVERINHAHMYSGPATGEKIYANTPHDELEMNTVDYGPTYGNLPLKADPDYSRVASLAE